MTDFILQFLFWLGFYWLAYKIIEAHIRAKINAENDLIAEIMDKTHIVKAEKHGEITYWFDIANDSFVAQGSNITELIQHCKYRYPTHSFLLVEGEKVVYKLSAPEWQPIPVNSKT